MERDCPKAPDGVHDVVRGKPVLGKGRAKLVYTCKNCGAMWTPTQWKALLKEPV